MPLSYGISFTAVFRDGPNSRPMTIIPTLAAAATMRNKKIGTANPMDCITTVRLRRYDGDEETIEHAGTTHCEVFHNVRQKRNPTLAAE